MQCNYGTNFSDNSIPIVKLVCAIIAHDKFCTIVAYNYPTIRYQELNLNHTYNQNLLPSVVDVKKNQIGWKFNKFSCTYGQYEKYWVLCLTVNQSFLHHNGKICNGTVVANEIYEIIPYNDVKCLSILSWWANACYWSI